MDSLQYRPVIESVKVVEVDLSQQEWRLGVTKEKVASAWTQEIILASLDQPQTATVRIELRSGRCDVFLPWLGKGERYQAEHVGRGLYLEGSESRHDGFLSSFVCALHECHCSELRRLGVGCYDPEFLAGPFRDGARYRRWCDITEIRPYDLIDERIDCVHALIFLRSIDQGLGKSRGTVHLRRSANLGHAESVGVVENILSLHSEWFDRSGFSATYALTELGESNLSALAGFIGHEVSEKVGVQ